MGYFSDYINKKMKLAELERERKAQLKRISKLRGRPVLAFASAITKADAPISISYEDKLPFVDQLDGISGDEIDIIIETPGGSGETVDDLVRTLRDRFHKVGFIIPGYAMSAGTLMVMAGDEILMGSNSALGPIDAQIIRRGKVYSAHAYLEWLRKTKAEVEATGRLNMALVPILQNISPGELESYQNALDFGKGLLVEWLPKYKFKFWETHATTGEPVTPEHKKERAGEIADKLCDHSNWKTHAKAIKIEDLRELRLLIEDISETPELQDAIERYYTLLLMYFEATPTYKLYETVETQIIKFAKPKVQAPPAQIDDNEMTAAVLKVQCPQCGQSMRIQANLRPNNALRDGYLPFPKDDRLKCPQCKNEINLEEQRLKLESDIGKPIL